MALEATRLTRRGVGARHVDVAVVRLRWMSNFTDFDPLADEPGVGVRYTARPPTRARRPRRRAGHEGDRRRPGAAARRGLDAALARRAAVGGPILGVCGGYQMLGDRSRTG